MAGERRYIPASDFCASVRDGTHDSPKAVARGRKLVTSRHLTTGRLDLSDAYLISDEDFEAINKRSKVDRWDVLISMIGTVGEPCLIKEEPDFAIKNIGLFKTKSEADGKWLYYFLRSKEAQQSIREQSRGTTQQYIPLGALRDLPILVADDPEEQKAIAAVLGALDDKIELNRRMNATLEAMARALFQSWFVDFDPVRAKLDGRKPVGIDAATAALFPDSFHETKAGHIPTGWQLGRFADLCNLKRGHDLPTNTRTAGNVPVISSSGISGNHSETNVRGPGVVTGRYGTIGRVFYVETDYWPLNTTLYVEDFRGNPPRFIFHALGEVNFGNYTDKGAVPGVNRNHIHEEPTVIPSMVVRQAFASTVAPLWSQHAANDRQSRTLATLRDTLLPRLLSGGAVVKQTKDLD